MNSRIVALIVIMMIVVSCDNTTTKDNSRSRAAIIGTWQLVSGATTEKGVTTVTDYTKGRSFIKIINKTHFAFLLHDLSKGDDSTAVFASGGGKYSFTDSTYTEHLEYCSDRQWEGHDFPFTITIKGDSLIQQGVEKVEAAGVDRLNVEKYFRVRN